MKNQLRRTVILLAVACVCYWIVIFFATKENTDMMNILRGATAGFGLAGCISFLMMLFDNYKQSRAK
ncbi:hypothetical protein D0C36_10420 [Mucilaginibacter conchicola]|uniref:Uncharacterized protein n=1 Tax=Mucilaginibacter conchicola TaxID=2303333 RepID=A0A372NRH8_9SPHI|nr:hypothetical protein [Mucilaginibacter conchicola]RFZ91855.1 hypothetical protein D0C36_10420 [Mucilaginibacter conchicola]